MRLKQDGSCVAGRSAFTLNGTHRSVGHQAFPSLIEKPVSYEAGDVYHNAFTSVSSLSGTG